MARSYVSSVEHTFAFIFSFWYRRFVCVYTWAVSFICLSYLTKAFISFSVVLLYAYSARVRQLVVYESLCVYTLAGHFPYVFDVSVTQSLFFYTQSLL